MRQSPPEARPPRLPRGSVCLIILRTHVFGERERAFAEQLRAGHDRPVVIAADETRRPLDVAPFTKISITRAACNALGLYCTPDFTWRTGDYVFYLARHQFPGVERFWVVEPDVEQSFGSWGACFDFFERFTAPDLISSHLAPATPDWYWRQSGRNRPGGAYRAFFPLVRMSARAVDVCHRERRRGPFSLHDRLHWPNDEVFVATELVHAGLPVADMNSFGTTVYTDDSFNYGPLDGDLGSFRTAPDRVYHAVLYGEAYRERRARIAAETDGRLVRARRKIQRHLR